MKWISVKDKLPEIHGKYLVFTGEWEGTFIYEYSAMKLRGGKMGYRWTEACTCVCKKENVNGKVTHWQMLPKIPSN